MNFERVVFAFFVLLALTLNFGFFYGDPSDPGHHHQYELWAALVVSVLTTILKIGDKSWQGSMLLAASLVADVQLIAASLVWLFATPMADGALSPSTMATIVSLSGGALIANIVSAMILLIETVTDRR